MQSDAGHDFAQLCDLFPPAWKLYVLGGVVRNLMLLHLRGINVEPADADLVIDGAKSMEALHARLGAFYLSANEFGGAKCRMRPDGVIFDVWRIDDHTNIATEETPHTIEQLLRHNLLDIDAIVWDPVTDSLHDCGCMGAIENGCIDLMGDEGRSPTHLAAQAAHVLVVAYKTGLPISDRAREFLQTASETNERMDLLRISKRKLPEASGEIDNFLEELLSGAVRLWPTRTNR